MSEELKDGHCKKCGTKVALATSRSAECTFDDEPYESGSYEKVHVSEQAIVEVQADSIIYMDICPECGTIDNVWIDEDTTRPVLDGDKECEWSPRRHCHNTSCGVVLAHKHLDFKFCPYCGLEIKDKP